MNARSLIPMALAPLGLAACTQGEPAQTPPVSPAAVAIGPARDCLPLTQYSTTRIRDDQTIDFIGGAGTKVWRVTLPHRCNGLKSADTFTFETSLTQLCKQDIIYPLRQYGNDYQRGAGCGMGEFVPVKLER
ncbi:hypothetical protein [Novosphingobium malaysiense]|uniref:Lipoprotein n=1 Tax=Novosphingobium malaysiense TaxID=1348853 RepID=A0A0B1ZGK2_9SPHN|nr:hypothetical protein [Novosphingobium malaysiense]KHK90221.1 hypothetical protein LK12_16325 [Novosphingobium malaysiense]